MPWLDYVWAKNKFVNRMLPARMHPVIAFALARARERTKQPDSLENVNLAKGGNSQDFMSRFIEIKANDSSIPEWYVTAVSNSGPCSYAPQPLSVSSYVLRFTPYFSQRGNNSPETFLNRKLLTPLCYSGLIPMFWRVAIPRQ